MPTIFRSDTIECIGRDTCSVPYQRISPRKDCLSQHGRFRKESSSLNQAYRVSLDSASNPRGRYLAVGGHYWRLESVQDSSPKVGVAFRGSWPAAVIWCQPHHLAPCRLLHRLAERPPYREVGLTDVFSEDGPDKLYNAREHKPEQSLVYSCFLRWL